MTNFRYTDDELEHLEYCITTAWEMSLDPAYPLISAGIPELRAAAHPTLAEALDHHDMGATTGEVLP